MKHKHYDKIVAKAANMSLVVFCKGVNNDCEWHVLDRFTMWSESTNYFLCLPQHKEAVLNSLNGGDSELSFDGEHWTGCNCNQPIEWNPEWWYMRPQSQSRIKQKKEKRWIGVYGNHVTEAHFETSDKARAFINGCPYLYSKLVPANWQFIEIEVEV